MTIKIPHPGYVLSYHDGLKEYFSDEIRDNTIETELPNCFRLFTFSRLDRI